MKKNRRSLIQRFYTLVGQVAVFGLVGLVSITCIGIKVKADKEGITFKQATAKLFLGEPRPPVETYTGERSALPSLEKISEKQKATSQPAPPRELTQGNGKATAQPVAYSVPPAKASKSDEYGVCPTCKHFHDLNKSCADDAAFVKSTVVKEETKAPTGKKQGKRPTQTRPTVAAKPTPPSPPNALALESLKSTAARPFDIEKDAPAALKTVQNSYPKKTRYWFPF